MDLRLRFAPRLPHLYIPMGVHRSMRSDITSIKQFTTATGDISGTLFYLSPAPPAFPLTKCSIFTPLLFPLQIYLPLAPYACGFPLVLKFFPVRKFCSLFTITDPSFKQESENSPFLALELSSHLSPDFRDSYTVEILPLGFVIRSPGW